MSTSKDDLGLDPLPTAPDVAFEQEIESRLSSEWKAHMNSLLYAASFDKLSPARAMRLARDLSTGFLRLRAVVAEGRDREGDDEDPDADEDGRGTPRRYRYGLRGPGQAVEQMTDRFTGALGNLGTTQELSALAGLQNHVDPEIRAVVAARIKVLLRDTGVGVGVEGEPAAAGAGAAAAAAAAAAVEPVEVRAIDWPAPEIVRGEGFDGQVPRFLPVITTDDEDIPF